jgi:thymidylate kinase
MSLSLLPTAPPPRSVFSTPVPLVGQLGAELARRGVSYCQWKGHGKRERWESGRGDIDLLVDRPSWPDFSDTLASLGFKLAAPPPGREAAGIMHFFALDERTGQMIHVHAYQRLVVGLPWRTHYRLPLERALLDSAEQRAVFRAPLAELEVIVLVLRLSLRHELHDPLRRSPPRWLDGAITELDRLEEQVSREQVLNALAEHLPEVSVELFEHCRDALLPNRSAWKRVALRLRLAKALSAHATRAPIFGIAERIWSRIRPGGQRLAGGGAVVALLGGDGSGKSTCADALEAWLGSALATVHVHLGLPPRSLATLLAGAALKLARLTGRSAPLRAHLELLRCGCTARDRYLLYRRARRFASGGGIAICERYPTPEGWALAGPSEAQGRALEAQSGLATRLRRWERSYYDRISAPDLVFLLQVDPDTAVRRKTNEPAAYVRERAQLTWETDWTRSGARIIDATQPLPQVVAALKSELWRTL